MQIITKDSIIDHSHLSEPFAVTEIIYNGVIAWRNGEGFLKEAPIGND